MIVFVIIRCERVPTYGYTSQCVSVYMLSSTWDAALHTHFPPMPKQRLLTPLECWSENIITCCIAWKHSARVDVMYVVLVWEMCLIYLVLLYIIYTLVALEMLRRCDVATWRRLHRNLQAHGIALCWYANCGAASGSAFSYRLAMTDTQRMYYRLNGKLRTNKNEYTTYSPPGRSRTLVVVIWRHQLALIVCDRIMEMMCWCLDWFGSCAISVNRSFRLRGWMGSCALWMEYEFHSRNMCLCLRIVSWCWCWVYFTLRANSESMLFS